MRISSVTAPQLSPHEKPAPRAAKPKRTDAFVGKAAATAAPSPELAARIEHAFRENLGRAPTADELSRFGELAGKVKPEQLDAAFKWVICSGPEWQARSVSQAELHREPTPDELKSAITWGNELLAQGKSTGEMRTAFEFVTRMGPEWQARSVCEAELGRAPTADELAATVKWGNALVAQGKSTAEIRQIFEYVTRLGPEAQGRAAYLELLGRLPTADEQQRIAAWGEQLLAQGKQPSDIRAAFNWVIASTPEYQARRTPDRIREEVAQWAVAQANDPTIGYSQTAGRFGNRVDAHGHRYFDCSGLVFTAYAQAGVHLGGDWTGAMQSTWRQWADQIPKDPAQMKAGDLILMNGHVVMYLGNGRCVGAQTSHAAFADQVRADIDLNHYLWRSDAMVLRPRV